jgi:hypothetical protein
MFCDHRRGPADYNRRRNGGDHNRPKGRRVGNVANLASGGRFRIVVVVPEAD